MAVPDKFKPSTDLSFEMVSQIKRSFWWLLLFSSLVNGLLLVSPVYMLQIYDRVLVSANLNTLLFLTFIAIVLLAAMAVFDAVRARILAAFGIWFETTMKARLLNGDQGRNIASSAARLRDLEQIRVFCATSGAFLLFDLPFTPFFLLLEFLIHPALGVVSLVGAMVIGAFAWATERASRAEASAGQAMQAKAGGILSSLGRAPHTMMAVGAAPGIGKLWRGAHDPAVALSHHAAMKVSALMASAKSIRFALQVLILGVGAYLVLQNQLTSGAMIAASIIMGRALAPLEQAIGSWRNLLKIKQAIERVLPFAPKVNEDEGATEAESDTGVVTGHLVLNRLFGGPKTENGVLLNDISFEAVPGSCHAVIGNSGAGKSALAQILIGAQGGMQGTAQLGGQTIKEMPADQRAKLIGYAPQEPDLFVGTVAQNIARFDPDMDNAAVIAAAKHAGVLDRLSALPHGLNTQVGDAGRALAAGERALVSLARAFYGAPVLVVLDDPIAWLDRAALDSVRQALAQAKTHDFCLVLFTHDMMLAGIADQITVLERGRAVATGPAEAVIARLNGTTPTSGVEAVPHA